SKTSHLSFAVLAALTLLFLLSSLIPDARLWGINHLRFLTLSSVVALAFVTVLVAGLRYYISVRRNRDTDLPIAITTWQLAAVTLGSTMVFYLLQPYYPFLGDGVIRSDEIAFGRFFSKTEPLDTFIHAMLYKITNGPLGFDGKSVYRILSSISGGVVVAYILKNFVTRGDGVAWPTAYIITLGSTMLFCGYVESYSIGYAFTLIYLLSGERFLRTGKGMMIAAISLAFAVSCHAANLILLPSFLILFWKWVSSEKQGAERTVVPIAGIVAIAVPTFFVFFYHGWEPSIPSSPFVSIAGRHGYLLLSTNHILDMLNELMLVMPAGLVLLWSSLRGWRSLYESSNSRFWFLIVLVVPSLLFIIFVDPKLGFARDWDLFATSAAVLAVAILLARLDLTRTFRSFEKAAVILAFVFLTSFLLVNRSEQSSTERFAYLLDIDTERSPFGREILSNYHQSRGELESAIEQLRLALEVGDNKRHRNLIAGMLYDLGQNESSAREALRAVRLAPDFAPAYYQLGKSVEKLGDLAGARQNYRKAVSLEPDAAHYRNSLGMICLNLGNYAEAEEMFAAAVRIKPDNVVYVNNLGSSNMALNKLQEAKSCFERALSMDSRLAAPMFSLARIYAAMGINNRAKEYCRMFLEYGTDSSLVSQAEVLLDSLR
ncbi:MAG: tetratricopeptide repeat protein, partial [candidate division Zixibacteria bacterium]|nr:tetratricopeptide repeat protein [candidate division Zixibacteria bacterium]